MRHMYTSKRNVRVIGMSLLLFLICSLHGWAQGLTITATDPEQPIEKGTDYSYDAGVLTVKTDKPVTITSEGIETSDRVIIEDETKATVTIENIYINSDNIVLDIQGNASVTLKLVGVNIFAYTGFEYPIIHCENYKGKTASLTIEGTGTLILDNSANTLIDTDAAFIGAKGRAYEEGVSHGGNITINGGVIKFIKSGYVDYYAPCIGGSPAITSNSGIINISDGIIYDNTSKERDAGIIGTNKNYNGNDGSITISGGIILCNTPIKAASISITGNPFITASEIAGTDVDHDLKRDSWNGVVIEDAGGKVYGSTTLPKGVLTIPSGKTLTIEAGKELTIDTKTTLINEGTIVNNGTITNKGVIGLKGTLTNNTQDGNTAGNIYKLGSGTSGGTYPLFATDGVLVTFDGNAGSEAVYNLPSPQIITKSTGNPIKPTLTPTRVGYTFIGWSESKTNGSNIISDWGSITSETDLMIYALWKYNPVITITNTEVNYGSSTGATVSVTGSGGSILSPSTIHYYIDHTCSIKTTADNSGAASQGGVPKNIGTYYIKVNYLGDNDNMNAESIIPYTIKTIELTVNTGTIKKVYDGNTTVDMSGFKLSGVASGDEQEVKLNTSEYSLAYASADVAAGINLTASGSLSLEGDKSGNYSVKLPTVLTGAITAKELTITPIADQTIYKDEHPVYTYSGQVGDEVPAFTGNLGVSQDNKIIVDKLKLADNEASGFKATNYTLKLSSTSVTITVEDQKLTEAYTTEATKISSVVGTDWHKAAVTLTPTEGFKIKQVSSNLLKSSTDEWKDNLVVDGNDGTYEVTYQLKRSGRGTELDAQTAPSGNQTLTIQLDKTVPDVAVATNKLTATVTLSDATSGLASCEYTWNKGGNVTESIVAGAKSHSITLTATAAGSYPLEIKVTDKAGNKTTYNKTIVLKEGTPPTPPTPPTPVYTYYDVTLPAVEGATTDPKAGTHTVLEGNRFIFSLTLDADYSESVPLVTVGGTVLTPRESDGKYVTERIWSDQTIEISGIVKNTPTANEDLNASATRIYQSEGTLCIDIPQPLEGKVYSPAGNELCALRLSAGTNRVYGLPQGVCIVCLSDGTREKVIIATH